MARSLTKPHGLTRPALRTSMSPCGGLRRIEWRMLGRMLLAAAAMAAVLWAAQALPAILLLPAVGLAGILYLALCIVLGVLPWNEVRNVREACARSFGPVG